MAFNAGYLLSNIILQIFSCWPVPKFWDKSIKEGHCVSLIPPDIAWGAMSMLSDLCIAILPLPMVWRLQLPRKSKFLLSLVFLSGIIAFTVATVRWIYGVIDLTGISLPICPDMTTSNLPWQYRTTVFGLQALPFSSACSRSTLASFVAARRPFVHCFNRSRSVPAIALAVKHLTLLSAVSMALVAPAAPGLCSLARRSSAASIRPPEPMHRWLRLSSILERA